MQYFLEIHSGLPREAPGSSETTRRAYGMIPAPPIRPYILDIGCGPGAQTLDLACISNGHVTAVDNHRPYIERVEQRSVDAELRSVISPLVGDMFSLDFTDGMFDIVWAEGSIYIIGFRRGLTKWRRLAPPGGIVAVSDLVWLKPDPPDDIRSFWDVHAPSIGTIDDRMKDIEATGYEPLGHFTLPPDAWWEYYTPLEQRIAELAPRWKDIPAASGALLLERTEIDTYRQFGEWYGYEFFVMQKT